MPLTTRPLTTQESLAIAVIAKWIRRCGLPLAILAWVAIALLLLWLLGHVIQTILLLTIAALLAYALTPAVTLLERIMPRFIAILVVYLLLLGGLGVLLYLIISAAIVQVQSLSTYIQALLVPGTGGQLTPLEQTVRSLGISQNQIISARDQIITYIEGFAGSIVPLLTGLGGAILDIILVAVISIYLLASGSGVSNWLRYNMPSRLQGRMKFFLDTLQRVIGGYIRGQLLLCGLVGVFVGVGMYIIGVPFALLLGVLAFLLEFIPVLGTLVSGAICVLLALTQGWLIAVIVLIYFVIVHVLEGDVLGPRIVGKTIGLHPVVSLAALIAGSELFGIVGALFAAPLAGVIQALFVAIWLEWRATHPNEFSKRKEESSRQEEPPVEDNIPLDPEPIPKVLS